jgi:hypothetical protein
MTSPLGRRRLSVPWFGLHRSWAAAVAGLLFVGVFVLRLVVDQPEDVVSLFYVLPIALMAMTWGLRGGVIGAGTGVVLIVLWSAIDDVDISLLGWTTRVLTLVLLGTLLGLAADGLEAAHITERELLATQLREREAAEINDSIIQGLVAAKWLIESGEPDRGVVYLAESIERTQALVGDLLRDRPVTPGMFRRRTEVQPFEPGRR